MWNQVDKLKKANTLNKLNSNKQAIAIGASRAIESQGSLGILNIRATLQMTFSLGHRPQMYTGGATRHPEKIAWQIWQPATNCHHLVLPGAAWHHLGPSCIILDRQGKQD